MSLLSTTRQLHGSALSTQYRGYIVPVLLFISFALTFLLQFNIIFKFPSIYTAIEHACLPAYSPHSHTQLPRTSFLIQLHHQVSLADHTESPPPAESLLGPKCHPAGSILSLIDDPTGSTSDAFPSQDQLLILRCARNHFFHTKPRSRLKACSAHMNST